MAPRLHPFDRALARRTAVVVGAAACLVTAIVFLTDEPTNTFAMRLARLAALAPLCSAVGVLASCAHARSRGELGALEALGVAPWRAGRGAALVALIFGVAAVALLGSPWVDPSSLFPRVTPLIDWVMDAERLVARQAATIVRADGTIELGRGAILRAAAEPGRAAALACIAPLALGVPPWAVTPMARAARVASLLATSVLLVVALHLIAAGRTSAAVGLMASAPIYAAFAHARFGR